ncbi:hypothetical protein D9Q98_010206 [Chlorella vulgaris]|uniref:RING-type domain-containing protein n=1 Tax=Chlorella vulgaris TaxID=3077 RepID=A0A9D4YWZ4_CHLVU|nr:hypothetical protein D9Q98_010206 [Chlorella vulgaris]
MASPTHQAVPSASAYVWDFLVKRSQMWEMSGGGGGAQTVGSFGELWQAALHGEPVGWAVYASVLWTVWLLLQVRWRSLALALAGGRPLPPLQHRAAASSLRTFLYAQTSVLLWVANINPQEFRSWEDVYFFCGERYQHCTANFRWNASGWAQALVLWNFVLCCAMLLQKFIVVWGLGGLMPGEEVVTRESFISIAWRLVPYWMNQWEQQWGAECSSMLFELPHFALELLVVLPCVQILCGRLRVMAQPHVREPPARQPVGLGQPAAAGAAAAAGDAAAAAPEMPADDDGAGGGGWVPDVMRCRWRHDPQQRRLLPRLRANTRAMALAMLVLAVAATNSLVVPLALERSPAYSERADRLLRFSKELSFLVTTGRQADTALWYQRLTAAASAAAQQQAASNGGPAAAKLPWAATFLFGKVNNTTAESTVDVAQPAAGDQGAGRGSISGVAGGAAFLAAALEGSSNSSRLDAKLALWSTLWQPLLPQHWLRAVLAADASDLADLNPAYLSALQYADHAESASLSAALHAAANDPAACKAAAAALQRHHEGAALGGQLPAGASGGDATVQLMLMSAMVAGVDAKQGPLHLRYSPAVGAAGHPGASPEAVALAGDLRWLRGQQRLYAGKARLPAGAAAASPNTTWLQQQVQAPLYRLLHKHCLELTRMRSTDHHRLIPLVEVSLAIMRLSCERFFSLLAVYLSFLVFRDPPPLAQRVARGIAAITSAFQLLVLYSFPAICWAYGAGPLFSSFVSLVFWTGPLVRSVERVRGTATSVQPREWHAATSSELERMDGQCAICWGDMPTSAGGGAGGSRPGSAGGAAAPPAVAGLADAAVAADPAAAAAAGLQQPPAGPPAASPSRPSLPEAGGGGGGGPGVNARAASLPCGHAFHRDCLQQWLQQCYAQGRGATCPMCQASVPLRVRYRMPWHRHSPPQQAPAAAGPGEEDAAAAAAAEAAADGIPGLLALVRHLQDDFRARFEPMLDAAAAGAGGAQAVWPPPEAVLDPPAAQQRQQQQQVPQPLQPLPHPIQQQQQQQPEQPAEVREQAQQAVEAGPRDEDAAAPAVGGSRVAAHPILVDLGEGEEAAAAGSAAGGQQHAALGSLRLAQPPQPPPPPPPPQQQHTPVVLVGGDAVPGAVPGQPGGEPRRRGFIGRILRLRRRARGAG